MFLEVLDILLVLFVQKVNLLLTKVDLLEIHRFFASKLLLLDIQLFLKHFHFLLTLNPQHLFFVGQLNFKMLSKPLNFILILLDWVFKTVTPLLCQHELFFTLRNRNEQILVLSFQFWDVLFALKQSRCNLS